MSYTVVLIPAFNEAASIQSVLKNIPDWVEEVIVINNASTDATPTIAKTQGATVLFEPRKGYGFACLKGMTYLANKNPLPEYVVFLDADFSDDPSLMPKLLEPIVKGQVDFVVGARVPELQEQGAMTFPQRFGNNLATMLMRLFFKSKFTDLGPFRAIKYKTLTALCMEDKTYGWTVEMQLKILKKRIPYTEIPVPYKQRLGGQSKVSGTLKGAIFAGIKILGWIFKYSLKK